MEDNTLPAEQHNSINWPITIVLLLFHIGAVAALFNFSWRALGVGVLMFWIAGSLGIGAGYHRLLCHRGFKAPKAVEYFLTLCGALALHGGPIGWVTDHRRHHTYAERDGDPHSPRRGLWWAHMGWIIYGVSNNREDKFAQRYALDLANDRFHVWISRWNFIPQIFLFAILYLAGGWQFILWGIFARVVFSWHAAFFLNSVGHRYGYRRFETSDDSRNNWWLALMSCGEGWHNNHHAHPASARHGLSWYEIDVTWYGIWAMNKLGLIGNVRVAEPPKKKAESEAKEAVKEAA